MNDYNLNQLLNFPQVQDLLHAHVSISNIACGLMDNDENILVGVGLQDVCTKFHWCNQDGLACCWRHDPDIKENLHSFRGDIFECYCKNGMVNIAMPIVIEGRRLGVFFTGQFFYDDVPPDPSPFKRQAEELGCDAASYLAALGRVPLLSRVHVDKTIRFLHQMIQMLTETGYTHLLRLRELEERKRFDKERYILDRAVNSSPDAFYLIDEQLRFTYVNDAACRSLGYSREELLTMTPLDIDPDLTWEMARTMMGTIFENGVIDTFESRHRAKDGRIFPVELNATIFEYDGSRFSLTIAKDISDRKESEQQLKLLNHALDHVHEGAFLGDMQGRFLYVNQQACRSLDYSREALLSMGVSDIDLTYSPEVLAEHIADLDSRGSLTFESWHRSQSGHLIPVEITSSLFAYGDTRYILSLSRDISERKQTERQLNLLNFAVDHVRDGIFLKDFEKARLLYVNQEACRSLEYRRDDLIGASVLDIDPNYTTESMRDLGAELLRRGSMTFESSHRTKSGRLIPVEITATIFEYDGAKYSLSLARNITERKHLETRLREGEKKFRTLAENSPNAILRYDTGCRCLYANPHSEKIMGFPKGASLGKTPMELFPSGEFREYQDRLEEVLRSGADATLEILIPDIGEGVRHHHILFTVERDQEGRITGALVIGHDITDIRAAEWDLLLLNHAMNQVDEAAYLISQDERLVFVNDTACRFLGYSRDELLTMRVAEVDADIESNGWRTHLKEMKVRGSLTFERRHKTKGGDIVPVEVNTNYFEYNGTGYLLGLARDISERKRVEQMTQARLRMLETANTPDTSLGDLLRLMADEVEAITGSAAGFYHFLEDEKSFSLQTWSSNTLNSNFTETAADCRTETMQENPDGIHDGHIALSHRWKTPNGHVAVARELLISIFRGQRIVAVIGVGDKPTDYTANDKQNVSLLGDFFWEIITRKLAEDSLRQRERELRTLAENLPDNIVRYDREGRAVYVNPVLERTLGAAAADMLGIGIREWHRDGSYEVYAQAVDATLESGEEGEVELVLSKPGEPRAVYQIRTIAERDEQGEVVGVLAIGRDITERKHAEELLQARERQFRTLAENSPDYIARYDTQGRIIYFNPKLCQLLELTSIPLGKTPMELFPGRQAYTEKIIHVMETGEATEIDRIIPDTGEGERYHNIRLVAERDTNGEIRGVLAIGRDITEHRRADQELRERQQRLNDLALELSLAEERERRRLATDLHDTLGQDLTLTRIKIGGLNSTELSLQQKKIIGEIKGLTEGAINRVRRLTKQLCPPILDSAGLGAALKWLARQMEADYALQITLQDDLQDKPLARIFQIELYNSVRELLINVAKHAGSATACLSLGQEDDMLVIRVEDDGIGFDAGHILNNAAIDGFGLFTIQHRIVHMGGSFHIHSTPGIGTEVTFKVPLERCVAQGESA